MKEIVIEYCSCSCKMREGERQQYGREHCAAHARALSPGTITNAKVLTHYKRADFLVVFQQRPGKVYWHLTLTTKSHPPRSMNAIFPWQPVSSGEFASTGCTAVSWLSTYSICWRNNYEHDNECIHLMISASDHYHTVIDNGEIHIPYIIYITKGAYSWASLMSTTHAQR